jgi:hypothetical protein
MLLHGSGAFDEVRVYWNGDGIGTASRVERGDLVDQIYWVRAVEDAGVSVTVPERPIGTIDASPKASQASRRRARPKQIVSANPMRRRVWRMRARSRADMPGA